MNLPVLARVLLAPVAVAFAGLVPSGASAMTLASGSSGVTTNSVRALADTIPDTPSLTTEIVNDTVGGIIEGPVDAGATVHDVATISNLGGSNGLPVGTVYFTFFRTDDCTGDGVDAGSAVPDDTGFADGSQPQGPLAPGSYSFTAHFVPDDPTLWTEAFADCEPLHVAAGDTALAPTVSKDARPSYTQTYAWKIAKSAGASSQSIAAGGTATFEYTVSVSHDDGTPGNWHVNGAITVTNPDASEVTLSGIDDAVDNGGHCTVDTRQGLTVQPGDTAFPYSCDYATAPSPSAGTNTVTVEWDDQALSDGSVLAAGNAIWPEAVRFRESRSDDRGRAAST